MSQKGAHGTNPHQAHLELENGGKVMKSAYSSSDTVIIYHCPAHQSRHRKARGTETGVEVKGPTLTDGQMELSVFEVCSFLQEFF